MTLFSTVPLKIPYIAAQGNSLLFPYMLQDFHLCLCSHRCSSWNALSCWLCHRRGRIHSFNHGSRQAPPLIVIWLGVTCAGGLAVCSQTHPFLFPCSPLSPIGCLSQIQGQPKEGTSGPPEDRKRVQKRECFFSLAALGSISGSSYISSLAPATARQACCDFSFLDRKRGRESQGSHLSPAFSCDWSSRTYPLQFPLIWANTFSSKTWAILAWVFPYKQQIVFLNVIPRVRSNLSLIKYLRGKIILKLLWHRIENTTWCVGVQKRESDFHPDCGG